MEMWKVIESHRTPLFGEFHLLRYRAVLPSSKIQHEFVVLESPDWVNVVGLTERGHILFIRQHRLGSGRVELEIPGGLVDSEDREPLYAAKRELLEETGFESNDWRLIGVVNPNPALHNNRCHTYLAMNCRRVRGPSPDSTESLEVLEIPLEEVPNLILSGEITHALALNGLFWFFVHRGLLQQFHPIG